MFQVELPCTVFLFEYDVGDEKPAEYKEKLYTYAPARPYIIEPGECCNGQVKQEYLEKGEKPQCVKCVEMTPLILYGCLRTVHLLSVAIMQAVKY